MVKLNSKMQWILSAIFATLILFGTYNSIFSIFAFLGFCILIIFCDQETILLQIIFVMPMATIFKLSPGSKSLFTIVLLIYIILHFKLPKKATLLIVVFSVYIIIGQLLTGGFVLLKTIKLICNMLFLSSILDDEIPIKHKKSFLGYIIGNIVASLYGLLADSSVFKIKAYVGEMETMGIKYGDLTRFFGLYGDPNYYAIGMLISLCLIVALYHRSDIKPVFAIILAVTIVYFLSITYSKSAILMLFLPLVCFLLSLIKKRKIGISIICIVLSVTLISAVLSGEVDALNIVIDRFNVDESGNVDVNSATSGRLDIWLEYANYSINDLRSLIFGEGINSQYLEGHAAHNTYLELIYNLGCIGTFLYLLFFVVVLNQCKKSTKKRLLINYSVLICIVVMYFFLSELFYFDSIFHIYFAVVVYGISFDKDDDIKDLTDGKVTLKKLKYIGP